MTDDQHQEGTPRSAGRWDPLPQGDYDDGATAFVKLPEGGVDALLASADSPLAAPGHGYVPPQITVNPATTAGTDPAATGQWAMPAAPADGVHWPDPNAVPHGGGDDRFTYNPGATGQWRFEETGPAEGAQPAPAPGHDVTGQWSIPVADGDLPDESGEFTTSSLVEQWGGTPPATLPGGAPAPWATEAVGQPWGRPSETGQQPAGHEAGHHPGAGHETGQSADAGHETGHHAGSGHGYEQQAGPGHERPTGSEYAHERPAGSEYAHERPADAGHEQEATGGPAHDRQTDTWSGHERSAAADGTRHQTHDGPPSGGHAREGHAAAPEAYAAERHASQARVTDPHTSDVHEPGTYAQEEPAPEAPGTEAHGSQSHGWDSHDSEAYAHAPLRPDGHEPPDSHSPEQPHARASEQAQPLPPERRPSEAHTEASAEAAEDASQAAHGPREAIGAAEAAQEAAGAVAAAERAAEAAAEPVEPHEHAHDTAAGTESGSETAEEPADPEASDGSAPPPSGEEHPLASYVLRVNGVERPVTDAWIGESLLYVLRERLGLAGAKDGCSQGECGACNIQVDGRLVASCLVPAVTAAGSEVRTVEGLAVDGQPSDVQRALAKCGAVQCGFCVPGMAMTVHDLLEGNPAPTELETRQALCGNLCRCSGYRGVVEAVKEVVAEREAHSAADAETDADEPRIPHQAGPGAGGVHPSAFEPAGHDQAYGHGQDGGQA